MQKYNISVNEYSQNGSIPVDQCCNGFTVINTGTTVAFVNGIPLNPGVPGTNNGESWTVGGNNCELFTGRLDLRFTGGSGAVMIIQKLFIFTP